MQKMSYSNFVYNEIYYSEINVPFSWEYRPGVSKVGKESFRKATTMYGGLVLQPPPCSLAISNHGGREEHSQGPIFPCSFQPSLLRKESWKKQDPFMEAYNNCTRTPLSPKSSTKAKKTRTGSRICKYRDMFSCKHSCDVSRVV